MSQYASRWPRVASQPVSSPETPFFPDPFSPSPSSSLRLPKPAPTGSSLFAVETLLICGGAPLLFTEPQFYVCDLVRVASQRIPAPCGITLRLSFSAQWLQVQLSPSFFLPLNAFFPLTFSAEAWATGVYALLSITVWWVSLHFSVRCAASASRTPSFARCLSSGAALSSLGHASRVRS